ncbi:hypothetical protein Hamer_G013859, partial [Homarus americanus]
MNQQSSMDVKREHLQTRGREGWVCWVVWMVWRRAMEKAQCGNRGVNVAMCNPRCGVFKEVRLWWTGHCSRMGGRHEWQSGYRSTSGLTPLWDATSGFGYKHTEVAENNHIQTDVEKLGEGTSGPRATGVRVKYSIMAPLIMKDTKTLSSHSTRHIMSILNKELINDMIVPLLHQWTKANALFKPPVINQCRTIELKLTKLWHKAVETSLGKGNLARKNEFLHTLDTLFDILTCKCSIQLCSESNCSHSGKRENNSHIDCGCPREKKIPVLELEFIKAQRTKAEGQGSMQMGSIDYSETKKQIANAKKREQIREREQKKKMKSEEAIQREEELCQDVYHFFDIPPINVNATKLSELVDLSLEVLEPPLTTSLTSQELRNLKETPMQVPKWPSHTQSVERCVKMVTEAAGHVYSHERRE